MDPVVHVADVLAGDGPVMLFTGVLLGQLDRVAQDVVDDADVDSLCIDHFHSLADHR